MTNFLSKYLNTKNGKTVSKHLRSINQLKSQLSWYALVLSCLSVPFNCVVNYLKQKN
jgi:hypothetical protein